MPSILDRFFWARYASNAERVQSLGRDLQVTVPRIRSTPDEEEVLPSDEADQAVVQPLVDLAHRFLSVGALFPPADPEDVSVGMAHVHLPDTPRLVGRRIGDFETLFQAVSVHSVDVVYPD